MKASVAIYHSHDDAIHALNILKDAGYPVEKVSLLSKVEIEDDKIHIKSNKPLIAAPLVAGTAIGTTLGLLTGASLLAIPGLGFLFGAGAIVGAFGGFELGAIAGGIGTILMELGVKDEYVIKYEEHIKNGKHLLIVKGSQEEIDLATKLLHHEHTEIHHH